MRRIVSEEELISWMNEQLHIEEDYRDCQFTSVYKLADQDSEGVNWSTPRLRCSGAPASICTARASVIEVEARAKFNTLPFFCIYAIG